ncbi:MAG: hypothetical protein ACRDVE_15115 [Actinocrinis sp.]
MSMPTTRTSQPAVEAPESGASVDLSELLDDDAVAALAAAARAQPARGGLKLLGTTSS